MRFNSIAISWAVFVVVAATASAKAPRTPWGDPDLQGAYTNSDESLIPMERPDSLAGKSLEDITQPITSVSGKAAAGKA